MVQVFLYDTGIINPNFTTATAFVDFYSATTAQRQSGEFKVSSPLTLKVTGFNSGISTNNQDVPSMSRSFTSGYRISTNPIKFSLTVKFTKPTSFGTNNTKDLPDMLKLLLMNLSNGHKDLYVEDTLESYREYMMSLGQWSKAFGKVDAGSGTSRRHLNVKLDAISQNESPDELSFNLEFTLLFDLTDVTA
jgi:hypothetical protein